MSARSTQSGLQASPQCDSATSIPLGLDARRVAMGLLLCLVASGCAALRPLDGMPARYLPESLKGPSRSGRKTIDLSLLARSQPAVYLVDSGDVLGVYIDKILGNPDEVPPVHFDERNQVPPTMGYPIPVREDGTISLPLLPQPLRVAGASLPQVEQLIRRAYTVDRAILNPDSARILVSLQQPRQHRILVIRQEHGQNGSIDGSLQFNLGQLKTGTGKVVTLPAYENDVLHALSETNGLPGLDAENTIYIIRRRGPRLPAAATRDQRTSAATPPQPPRRLTHQTQPLPLRNASGRGGHGLESTTGGIMQVAYQPSSAPAIPRPTSDPAIQIVGGRSGSRSVTSSQAAASSRDLTAGGSSNVNYAMRGPAIPQRTFDRQLSPVAQRPVPYSSSVYQPTAGHAQAAAHLSSSQQYGQPAAVPLLPGEARGIRPVAHPVQSPQGYAPTPVASLPGQVATSVPLSGPGAWGTPDASVATFWPGHFGGHAPTIENSSIIKIPVRLAPGEFPQFSERDIILYDGDIVFIESRETEVFYTGGLLGGGQYTLPRDYDLDVLGAVSIAQGRQGNGGGNNGSVAGISALNQDVSVSASKVILLRNMPNGTQVTIKIDLYQALRNPAERIAIQPGDLVILQYTPVEAVGAWFERYILRSAVFGVAASQINNGN